MGGGGPPLGECVAAVDWSATRVHPHTPESITSGKPDHVPNLSRVAAIDFKITLLFSKNVTFSQSKHFIFPILFELKLRECSLDLLTRI